MRYPKVIIVCLIFFLLIMRVLPLYAKGKPDSPPGQDKNGQGNTHTSAVVGSVDNITNQTIVIEDKKGNKQKTNIDNGTQVIGRGNKPLKLGAIKLKDTIALITSEGTASGQLGKVTKIFVQDASASAQSKRRAVAGVITAINNGVITLAHIIHRDRIYTIFTDSTTEVNIKGNENAKVSDLSVGMHIAAVGDLNPTGGILAKRIHVIPGQSIGVFKRFPVATPSATLTATPSATPAITTSPSATLTPSDTPTIIPTFTPIPTL